MNGSIVKKEEIYSTFESTLVPMIEKYQVKGNCSPLGHYLLALSQAAPISEVCACVSIPVLFAVSSHLNAFNLCYHSNSSDNVAKAKPWYKLQPACSHISTAAG